MQLAPKSWEGEVAPAWAPSEAMLVAALHIDEGVLQGGDLEGGADVHLFLEQALIAVSTLKDWHLMGNLPPALSWMHHGPAWSQDLCQAWQAPLLADAAGKHARSSILQC